MHIPKYAQQLGDNQLWIFRANHRAFFELEKSTKTPLADLLVFDDGTYNRVHEFAFAMSASFRNANNIDMKLGEFLDILPLGQEWVKLKDNLWKLLFEAFATDEDKEEAESQEDPPTPVTTSS